MCIAILVTPGAVVPPDQLQSAWNSNRDGGGIMWADGNKLHITKGFFIFADFAKCYYGLVKKFPQATYGLHMRIATSGRVCKDNCHPFLVDENMGMMHNGVITCCDTKKEDELSDTRTLVEGYLRNITPDFYKMPLMMRLLKEIVGWSKLVFLRNDGKFYFVNELSGHWNKDNTIWYSGHSYECSTNFHKSHYRGYQSDFGDCDGSSWHSRPGWTWDRDKHDWVLDDNQFEATGTAQASDDSANTPSVSSKSANTRISSACFRCGTVFSKKDTEKYDEHYKLFCQDCWKHKEGKERLGMKLCTICNYNFTPFQHGAFTCTECSLKPKKKTEDDVGEFPLVKPIKEHVLINDKYLLQKRWITNSVGTSPQITCSNCKRKYYPTPEKAVGLCGFCSEKKERDYKQYKYCEACHMAYTKSGDNLCPTCVMDITKTGIDLLTLGFQYKATIRWGNQGFGLRGHKCVVCNALGGGSEGEDKIHPIDLRTGYCKSCFLESEEA